MKVEPVEHVVGAGGAVHVENAVDFVSVEHIVGVDCLIGVLNVVEFGSVVSTVDVVELEDEASVVELVNAELSSAGAGSIAEVEDEMTVEDSEHVEGIVSMKSAEAAGDVGASEDIGEEESVRRFESVGDGYAVDVGRTEDGKKVAYVVTLMTYDRERDMRDEENVEIEEYEMIDAGVAHMDCVVHEKHTSVDFGVEGLGL